MREATIKAADRALSKGRYDEALRLLEPMIPLVRDDSEALAMLGLACLMINDPGGSEGYLGRALSVDPGNPDIMAALCVAKLKRGDTQGALELALEGIEEHPRHKALRRVMDHIRAKGDARGLSRSGIETLLKGRSRGRPLPWRLILSLAIAIVALAAIALNFEAIVGLFPRGGPDRLQGLSLSLSDAERENPAGSPSGVAFSAAEREIASSYEAALRAFSEYRDNEATISLNKVLLSSAVPTLKAKASYLKEIILKKEPSFADFKGGPSWEELSKAPSLYDGCRVLLKGGIANYREEVDGLRFDLLVGYETGALKLGDIPVIIPRSVAARMAFTVRPYEAMEVLGTYRAALGEEPRLVAISVHPLPFAERR
jgi:tetratricopeptide (TPR) repeat protein